MKLRYIPHFDSVITEEDGKPVLKWMVTLEDTDSKLGGSCIRGRVIDVDPTFPEFAHIDAIHCMSIVLQSELDRLFYLAHPDQLKH